MGGFRDAIKGGGGFLNNEDGEITGYIFTNKNVSGEKSEWVYFVPTIKRDGADDEVTQHFFMGGLDQYGISKDGQTVTSDGGVTLGKNTPMARLMDSIIENGFAESELPDLAGGDDLELSALVDRRFRFVQEVDEEGTKKRGPRTYKNKQGKTVSVPRTNTVVSKVYDVEAKSSKNGKSSGKADVKAKSGGKSKKNDDDELDTEAISVLVDLLEGAKDNELPYTRLSMALTKALMKNDNGEVLRKMILDTDFLEKEEGWTFDGKTVAQA